MEEKRYYGDREIINIKNDTETESSLLTFSDGSSLEISSKMVEHTITDKPIDATSFRDKRTFPIVAKMLEVLLDYNVNISDVDFITQRVILSLNDSIKKAEEILWRKKYGETTMVDVNRILMPISGDMPSPYQDK